MNKAELIRNVANLTDLPTAGVKDILDVMTDEITKALTRGEKVSLPGFVFVEPYERPPHKARNPSTGEVQTFPATKTARIRISNQLKDAINNR